MGIGRILGAAAPIAAGYFGGPALAGFTGGATSGAIAAGALTGAGIAALSGQDMLGGAVTGGLGGMGGGAMRGAADATKLAASGVGGGTTAGVNAVTQGSQQFISPFTTSGVQGIQTASPGLAGGAGSTLGQAGQYTAAANAPMYTGPTAPNLSNVATGPVGSSYPNFDVATAGGGGYDSSLMGSLDRGLASVNQGFESGKAAFNEPGAFLENLGDGDKVIGAGKVALTAAQPIAAGLYEPYESFEDQRKDKYDPNSQLDLSMDTGIGAALDRDTGLRLLAEGGEVGGGVTGAGLAAGTPVAGAAMSGSGGAETFESMVASGVDPANAAAMFGMDPSPYLDMGPGMEFTGTPSTPTSSGIGSLPPPPAPFSPDPGFDYETYSGGYMTPGGMMTPVGMAAGVYGGADDLQQRRKELGMAKGGHVQKFVMGGQPKAEYTDSQLSSLAEYGVVPQYKAPQMYGMGASQSPTRVPVKGIVDVGGKFVSDPKGDITDVEFVEKYDYILDADKNKKKQDSGAPMMSPNQAGAGNMGAGASQALAGLAKGVARNQQSQAGDQIKQLGGLARGGYLETGGIIGDGMSDDIKATINNSQPARLSDGEFVIPADVVSHLGNGSSDAGAERLYSMMDKVRQARTGNKKQGKEIKPERYMPA